MGVRPRLVGIPQLVELGLQHDPDQVGGQPADGPLHHLHRLGEGEGTLRMRKAV